MGAKRKYTCDLCGKRIAHSASAQAEHVYQEHTAVFFNNVVRAAPKLKAMGEQIGSVLRKVFGNAR